MARVRIAPYTWYQAKDAPSFWSASGAFCCRGGLYEGCGDSYFQAGDRGDEEALCLLYLRLLKGVVLWVPLDKEFFHKGV